MTWLGRAAQMRCRSCRQEVGNHIVWLDPLPDGDTAKPRTTGTGHEHVLRCIDIELTDRDTRRLQTLCKDEHELVLIAAGLMYVLRLVTIC